MKELRVVALVLVLVFVLTPALAVNTTVDYDREFDFSDFKSYAWLEGSPAGSEIIQRRVVSVLNDELQAIGMTLAKDSPDFYVVTHVAAKDQQRIYVDTYGYYGRGYRGGWGTTTVNTVNYTEGTLTIDVVDADSMELVWRGIAKGTLSAKAQKNEKKFRKAVQKLLRELPPAKD